MQLPAAFQQCFRQARSMLKHGKTVSTLHMHLYHWTILQHQASSFTIKAGAALTVLAEPRPYQKASILSGESHILLGNSTSAPAPAVATAG